MRVFISGPYTHGDVCQNVRKAIDAAEEIAKRGHVPFIPHLSHFWHLVHPHDYGFWIKQDIEWLQVCDCVFVIDGESPGSDGEVQFAESIGLKIVRDLEEL